MRSDIPDRFLTFNEQDTKDLTIVVKIQDAPNVLSSRPLYNRITYGMTGLTFGQPGLVYGGLVPDTSAKDILSLEGSSLSLDQTIDPEEGRGTISQLTLAFVDIDGFMTQLVSPGILIDEILGKEVEVFIGFKDIAWPDDFLRVFRGYISGITEQSGRVTLSLSDPNLRTKQELLAHGSTKTTATLADTDDEVQVDNTGTFMNYILSHTGLIPFTYFLYLKIGSEWILRDQTDVSYDDKFANLIRSQRGTVAETSVDSDTAVDEGIELNDHPIDMALKLMLSGWGGPFVEGVAVEAFNQTGDPVLGIQEQTIIMPKGVDVVRDYGLYKNDVVYVTGGVNDGKKWYISGFRDLAGGKNRIIDLTGLFTDPVTTETTSAATLGFRSFWDEYPLGLKLTPKDVDVERFMFLKETFLFQAEYVMQFFLKSDISNGKDFIESQLYKPIGAYSLTRGGKLSIGLTKPPLASEDLITIDNTNILNPENIQVKRALNDRKFFNRVDYSFDYDDDGQPRSFLKIADFESRSLIGIESILSVEAQGARSALQVEEVFQRRGQFILSRYKRGAATFPVNVTFGIGCLIEAGDVVAVRDDGELQLPNFETGERDIGFKLFEVIRRTLDLKTAKASLQLASGVGAEATDRFGVIAPSSYTDLGSSTTVLVIKPSFGAKLGENERDKWKDHFGEKIIVRTEDFSTVYETTLLGFDPVDKFKLIVDTLPGAPDEDWIIDISSYPDSTDRNENRQYKQLYVFQSPQVSVVSGADSSHFDVDSGDSGKFLVGAIVRVHSYDYSDDSDDVKVLSVTGDTIETEDLGFTPDSTHLVDLIGFADSGGAYRFI